MIIEGAIYTLLSGLAGGRVFPDIAPANTALPYITHQQVGGESIRFLDPAAPSMKNARFQINVWAASRSAASGLMAQAEAALIAATTMQVSPLGAPISSYEVDTTFYGSLQHFTIWADR